MHKPTEGPAPQEPTHDRAGDDAEGGLPYHEVRFRPPARPDRFVVRARLTWQLDALMSRPVTVVTGPAGTGKSLAVAEWARSGSQQGAVVWVRLEREDAALSYFWTSLLKAARIALPQAMAALVATRRPDPSILQQIANAAGGTLTLVLDDLQRVREGTANAWLDELLRFPPDGVHLVLVSRCEPTLSLARLRLEEGLGEVRAVDLAFTRDEAQAMLDRDGVVLRPSSLTRLMECTGGWAAVLRLAVVSLRDAPDHAEAAARRDFITLPIADYLWDEVLQFLPDSYGEFLLRTSVSARLCTPLALVLSRDKDSEAKLQVLAREQLLTREIDGMGVYHTHPLLTAVLRPQIKAGRPELEQQLHREAAEWFESQEMWLQAVDHAVRSADWQFAGAVAMRSGVAALFGADQEALLRVIARIPRAAAVDNPELALVLATAAWCRQDTTSVESLLSRAEPEVDALPEPRRSIASFAVALLRSGQAHRKGDGVALLTSGTAAHHLLKDIRATDAPGWSQHRGITLSVRGVAELWAGDPLKSITLIRESISTFPPPHDAPFSGVYTHGVTAVAEAMAGQMRNSARSADHTIALAEKQGEATSYETQWAWLARSMALLQAGDLEGARAARIRCAELAMPKISPFVGICLSLAAAQHHLTLGQVVAARRDVEAASDAMRRHASITALRPPVTMMLVELAIAERALERASSLLDALDDTHDSRVGNPHFAAVARAHLSLVSGRPGRLRESLAATLDAGGLPAVYGWLMVSAAEDQERRDSHAVEAMARALDLAAAEQVILPFTRPSRQLASSLRRHLDLVRTHRDMVQAMLATAPGADAPQPAGQLAPLTEREMAVLLYLPTMGSNAEIAAELFVSENTVKQHLKSVYRKLSVSSRREAVRVARAAGLFDEATVIE